jgi:hypothetical protein
MSSHVFFCNETDCSNMTTYYGATCYDCCEAKWTREPVQMCEPAHCPGCDREMWAVLLGTSGYCGPCWQQRYGLLACEGESYCTCNGSEEPCDHCAQYLADKAEEEIWCGTDEPQCTCNRETGLMCDLCSEEYAEPCRGCGVSSQLWTDNTYCRACFVARHGDEFPQAHPPLPPSPEPRHTSLESMRAEIAEIEARLRGNMTQGQKDDWAWILQNRRADLAEAEKDMWDQYDQDDLRKLDLQCRR